MQHGSERHFANVCDEVRGILHAHISSNRLESKKAPDTEGEKAVKSTGLGIARLYSATAGANGANGAEAEREDVPARELTAKERQQ